MNMNSVDMRVLGTIQKSECLELEKEGRIRKAKDGTGVPEKIYLNKKRSCELLYGVLSSVTVSEEIPQRGL